MMPLPIAVCRCSSKRSIAATRSSRFLRRRLHEQRGPGERDDAAADVRRQLLHEHLRRVLRGDDAVRIDVGGAHRQRDVHRHDDRARIRRQRHDRARTRDGDQHADQRQQEQERRHVTPEALRRADRRLDEAEVGVADRDLLACAARRRTRPRAPARSAAARGTGARRNSCDGFGDATPGNGERHLRDRWTSTVAPGATAGSALTRQSCAGRDRASRSDARPVFCDRLRHPRPFPEPACPSWISRSSARSATPRRPPLAQDVADEAGRIFEARVRAPPGCACARSRLPATPRTPRSSPRRTGRSSSRS